MQSRGIARRPQRVYDYPKLVEKGGLRVITFFRHHRQRGPIHALQMYLQG